MIQSRGKESQPRPVPEFRGVTRCHKTRPWPPAWICFKVKSTDLLSLCSRLRLGRKEAVWMLGTRVNLLLLPFPPFQSLSPHDYALLLCVIKSLLTFGGAMSECSEPPSALVPNGLAQVFSIQGQGFLYGVHPSQVQPSSFPAPPSTFPSATVLSSQSFPLVPQK